MFNDFDDQDKLDDHSYKSIIEFINNFKVEKEQLLELSMQFPARAIKKLIGSGILNEIV